MEMTYHADLRLAYRVCEKYFQVQQYVPQRSGPCFIAVAQAYADFPDFVLVHSVSWSATCISALLVEHHLLVRYTEVKAFCVRSVLGKFDDLPKTF